MEIAFSESFKKSFTKRIKSSALEDVFWQRVGLFIDDPFDPKLKTHKLSGKLKGMWSFTIDYNLRLVFFFTPDKP